MTERRGTKHAERSYHRLPNSSKKYPAFQVYEILPNEKRRPLPGQCFSTEEQAAGVVKALRSIAKFVAEGKTPHDFEYQRV